MSSEDANGQIEATLEEHELAVKRALESLGSLEERLTEIAEGASPAEQNQLEPLGRALEQHVRRLESLVQTLDDHKRAVRDESSTGSEAMEAAIERSRRRAQQEPTPPGSDLSNDGGEP